MLGRNARGRPPTVERELRVAILCSDRAPGLRDLLGVQRLERSWQIVVGLTSGVATKAAPMFEGAGLPTLTHDIVAFYRTRGARLRDLAVRAEYDRATLALLRPYRPDLIVLCGYLHIATAVLLEAFPNRVINIHDSDLAITGPDGRPRYRGLRSTRDAILAGEPETRSTVHVATSDVDVGPLLVRSWGFPTHPLVHDARTWGATDILQAYAYAQREWMMRAAWGRLLAHAIAGFARPGDRLPRGPVIAGGCDADELAPLGAPEREAWTTSA